MEMRCASDQGADSRPMLRRYLPRFWRYSYRAPRTKEIVFSIPGWLSVKLEPNQTERQAAWSLYVEISTRIASQPFNRDTGSVRAVLSSLYTLFEFTRQVLRDAGPQVAYSPESFGPLAIRFLIEVLAPFTTKWHEPLKAHERLRPE